MPEYVEDKIAFPHLMGLVGAIGTELEYRGLPGLCDTVIGAGAEVAFDNCSGECGGMGWSRLVSAYASSSFPDPDAAPTRGPKLMAETFEIGLVRGIELPDDPRDGMDSDAMKAAARLQLADMSAMLAVICRYFGDRGIPYIVGTYTPYGPLGACVGGSWGITASTGLAPKPRS